MERRRWPFGRMRRCKPRWTRQRGQEVKRRTTRKTRAAILPFALQRSSRAGGCARLDVFAHAAKKLHFRRIVILEREASIRRRIFSIASIVVTTGKESICRHKPKAPARGIVGGVGSASSTETERAAILACLGASRRIQPRSGPRQLCPRSTGSLSLIDCTAPWLSAETHGHRAAHTRGILGDAVWPAHVGQWRKAAKRRKNAVVMAQIYSEGTPLSWPGSRLVAKYGRGYGALCVCLGAGEHRIHRAGRGMGDIERILDASVAGIPLRRRCARCCTAITNDVTQSTAEYCEELTGR